MFCPPGFFPHPPQMGQPPPLYSQPPPGFEQFTINNSIPSPPIQHQQVFYISRIFFCVCGLSFLLNACIYIFPFFAYNKEKKCHVELVFSTMKGRKIVSNKRKYVL